MNGSTSGLATRARQSMRRLLTEWRLSVGVVLILGIGVAPATIGLTVVNRVLLQPLPFEEPDRIGVVRIDVGELVNHPGLDQDEILNLRDQEGVFDAVEWAIFNPAWLEVGGEAVAVSGSSVSSGLFEMLGVSPLIGRSFTVEDYDARVVILSHHVWRTNFGADRSIIGRSVSLWGAPREVVGVMPADFRLLLGRGSYAPPTVDVWTPVEAVYGKPGVFLWGWNTLVRLADGVSYEQANASLEAFALQQKERYPDYGDSRLRFSVSPLLTDLVRESRPAIVAALVGVLLLLVTATVNASALIVVGQRRRRQETAVRAALGASRGRLLTDVLQESVLLITAGGALGAGLAVWGGAGLRVVIPPEVPRWENIVFGWDALVIPVCLVSVVVLIVSTVASWRQTSGSPWKSLGSASDRTATPRAAGQSVLVGVQVVMAVVLLFAAVQLFRSASELARTDLGFKPRNVVAFEVSLAGPGWSFERENREYRQIRDRLALLPGVVSVGAISNPPLRGRGTINNFVAGGTQAGVIGNEQAANFYAVLPGYFESVRNPVLRGRDFTDVENAEGLPVAVIDETLAQSAFPGQDPIGKRIGVGVPGGSRYSRLPDPRIIGVVAHSRAIDPTEVVRPQVYLPFGLWRWAPLYFTVRTEGDPRSVIQSARDVVRELGTGQPLMQVQLLSDNLSSATSVLRAVTTLVVILALSAAFLSALGLYAVVSYVVIQQRRAIAIRSVLGASPGSLLRMQLKRVAIILLAAAPAGVIVAALGARVLDSLVYGVAVRDIGSLAAATALGVLAGLLATYVPARRAAKEDPLVAFEVD
ncbi:MAG: ABC transporter permease [Gemmatimonadota bacterium]|nr:MAG: ABC transporter permease [Gemmatimonadota bacterium]